ncbi:hypothetical protein [Nocardioides sp. GY 10127]|uniref:DUF6941 family protein n=1 Tax=Nocardioides sp. GY 10127 TaxID=2569762 RepID=UPI0010A83D92|nr:hypothetical protein [Nocardioides sp. GY 10127]TIC84112.1 hypothetical protein E8D37_04705 [Nocardioides sp. GY 10127]
MARIDYAFVADFAKVEPSGTLTVVGASWTFVTATEFPSAHRMAVAGRVRAALSEGAVELLIAVQGPNDSFRIEGGATLVSTDAAAPYGPDNAVGYLFALELTVPLLEEGLYEIFVDLPEHDEHRRLAFEARLPPA